MTLCLWVFNVSSLVPSSLKMESNYHYVSWCLFQLCFLLKMSTVRRFRHKFLNNQVPVVFTYYVHPPCSQLVLALNINV